MNHAIGMSGMDGPRQGLDELCRRTHRLGRAVEVLGQAAAGHELEDKVGPPCGLADIVNLDDVGMLQASERRGLCAKAGQVLRAGLEPGQDHLQRHGAIETELPGLVNDAHAAAADFLDDFVTRHHRQLTPAGRAAEICTSNGKSRSAGQPSAKVQGVCGKSPGILVQTKTGFPAPTQFILRLQQVQHLAGILGQVRVAF